MGKSDFDDKKFGMQVSVVLSSVSLAFSLFFMTYYLMKSNSGVASLLGALKNTKSEGIVSDEIISDSLLAQMDFNRVTLVSCGMFLGVVVCFLGMSLFLLGIKGDVDAKIENGNAKVTLSRLAPGSLVIIAGTVLIGVCIVNRPVFLKSSTSEKLERKSEKEELLQLKNRVEELEKKRNAGKVASGEDKP